MEKARLHSSGEFISAWQVKNGEYSRSLDFVDPEYSFRVTYVTAAKGHVTPYFRIYYSLEDYKAMSPEQKTRYDILRDQQHNIDSKWHRDWEMAVSDFAENEKYIKDPESMSYKRADAFYQEHNLCIEFQHSYIANSFNERNDFYSKFGYKVIWLFDLTKHDAKLNDGKIELVEDNACGFFRVAEEKVDLSRCPVFIQVKDGKIYKVKSLFRKEIDNEMKSTIRYFDLSIVYNDSTAFINALRNCEEKLFEDDEYKALPDIWQKDYRWIVVENKDKKQIRIFADGNDMNRDNQFGCITYRFVTFSDKTSLFQENSSKFYMLSKDEEKAKAWKLLKCKYK